MKILYIFTICMAHPLYFDFPVCNSKNILLFILLIKMIYFR